MTTKVSPDTLRSLAWEITHDMGSMISTKATPKLQAVSVFGLTPERYTLLSQSVPSLAASLGCAVVSLSPRTVTGIAILRVRGI